MSAYVHVHVCVHVHVHTRATCINMCGEVVYTCVLSGSFVHVFEDMCV